jgi:CHAD domain-containing protein
MRSNLHTFAPLLDADWASNLRERLRWLQDALSPVRDADVLLTRLQELAEKLSPSDYRRAEEILQPWRAERTAAHERLRQTLRDERYVPLLSDLVEAAKGPRCAPEAERRACGLLAAILKRPWKKARKAVRRAGPVPSNRALHDIRIKSKHLRYAAEAFAPVAGKPARRFARSVEALQTTLGNQHDGVYAVSKLREYAGPSEAVFVAGELAMLAQSFSDRARSQWRKRWRKVSAKRNRFW